MKKIINILVILVIFSCNSNTQDNNTLLLEAIKLSESGQTKESIEIYHTILDNSPDSTLEEHCLFMMSNLNGKLGNYYDQISWAEKLLENNPNSADGYSEIGFAFQGLEKYDLALENYWTATQLDTGVMTPFAAAILAEDYKKPEQAIKFYKECIKKDSFFTPAYYNLSVNLANIDDYKNAKSYCETLMKLKPNDSKIIVLYKDIISHL
jgi:tetratricopeptide (TPR) repeat protein